VDGRRARDADTAAVVAAVAAVVDDVTPATDDDDVAVFSVGDVVDAAAEATGTGILLPSFVASLGDNRGGCKDSIVIIHINSL